MIRPLRSRVIEPEIMDDPELCPKRHRKALDGLDRLQKVSGTARRLWRAARPHLEFEVAAGRPIRWLDMACGSGRILIDVVRKARQEQVAVEATGVDFSPEALSISAGHAERAGVSVDWVRHDLLSGELPGDFDVVSCSLFVHHLQDEQVAPLLARASRAAKVLVVDDLSRDRRGLWLAWLASRTFTRSDVVHVDSLLSVRSALTKQEMDRQARDAGLYSDTRRTGISRHWPRRLLLTSVRADESASADVRQTEAVLS